MKDLREKFIGSSIIDVLEGSECVPSTCPLSPPCGADSNLKAVICLC